MIKSLTGFGSVELNDESYQVNIIIRTINSRFLDIKFRGIDLNPKLEMEIRKEIQKSLSRGNVQVQIYNRIDTKNNNGIKFNRERYEQIESLINTIQKEYGRRLELSDLISLNDLSDLISLNDLTAESGSIEIADSILLNGIRNAVKQVDSMRKVEGVAIGTDIKNRVGLIMKSLQKIEKLSEDFVHEQNIKYRKKIKSLLNDIKVDEDRIALEIAINVDRFDFTEEIVRSISHCDQLTSFLKVNEPIGKKLNFILQELSREVNTIGSKSPSSAVSQVVIELKSEIEKIREQVQNIL
ncbi:MAG: YicC/YloC family endoribonuclease [Candidatus Neomarinimicrobiota bacterium]